MSASVILLPSSSNEWLAPGIRGVLHPVEAFFLNCAIRCPSQTIAAEAFPWYAWIPRIFIV